jgi:hypothetical protein
MAQPIVHNTGTNYTLYYNVVNYLKTILSNHPSVDVVTLGDIVDLGEREFPAYPIANIQIVNTSFGTSVTNFDIELIVADKIKNKNNESNPITNAQTIPFYGVDDKPDIYSNTLAIINDVTSYTQRGVAGFEINDDIECEPFSEQFDNGLAGWVARFTITTHNDKNRCLFFLVPENVVGFLLEDCLTGLRYKAILDPNNLPLGGIFSTIKTPNAPITYPNLVCYTIIEPLGAENNWDFYNLPILDLPLENYVECNLCQLWINPKIWGTTPATWGSAPNADFRTWITD